MRIFERCAQVIFILRYMSGEYLNGMELSLLSHRHEYVHCVMKCTKIAVALDNTDDPCEYDIIPKRP